MTKFLMLLLSFFYFFVTLEVQGARGQRNDAFYADYFANQAEDQRRLRASLEGLRNEDFIQSRRRSEDTKEAAKRFLEYFPERGVTLSEEGRRKRCFSFVSIISLVLTVPFSSFYFVRDYFPTETPLSSQFESAEKTNIP